MNLIKTLTLGLIFVLLLLVLYISLLIIFIKAGDAMDRKFNKVQERILCLPGYHQIQVKEYRCELNK